MTSYFVASDPLPHGGHPVHDRNRCPPSCFPADRLEYLGEFLDRTQALAVARLRYAQACVCACCDAPLAAARDAVTRSAADLSPLRP